MTTMTSEDFVARIEQAKQSNDWRPVFAMIPYFTYLGLRLEKTDGRLTCILPEDKKFIGNPTLPALHGGVIGAFLESTALVHLFAKPGRRVANMRIEAGQKDRDRPIAAAHANFLVS